MEEHYKPITKKLNALIENGSPTAVVSAKNDSPATTVPAKNALPTAVAANQQHSERIVHTRKKPITTLRMRLKKPKILVRRRNIPKRRDQPHVDIVDVTENQHVDIVNDIDSMNVPNPLLDVNQLKRRREDHIDMDESGDNDNDDNDSDVNEADANTKKKTLQSQRNELKQLKEFRINLTRIDKPSKTKKSHNMDSEEATDQSSKKSKTRKLLCTQRKRTPSRLIAPSSSQHVTPPVPKEGRLTTPLRRTTRSISLHSRLGQGLVDLTTKEFHNDKASSHVFAYWNDVNELVSRLRLLISSASAGHTGHNNEIVAIIEELREANVIE